MPSNNGRGSSRLERNRAIIHWNQPTAGYSPRRCTPSPPMLDSRRGRNGSFPDFPRNRSTKTAPENRDGVHFVIEMKYNAVGWMGTGPK